MLTWFHRDLLQEFGHTGNCKHKNFDSKMSETNLRKVEEGVFR